MRALVLCFSMCCASGAVLADEGAEAPSPVEVAWTQRARGEDALQFGAYAHALVELEAAARVIPSAALDYDIARCLDRLDRVDDAVLRYRAAARGGPELARAARDRIDALMARVAGRQRRPRSLGPPIALGAGTLTLAIIGGALARNIEGPLADLRIIGCDAGCADAEALRRRSYAGYGLLGAAGLAAIVDVVLWVRWARARPRL